MYSVEGLKHAAISCCKLILKRTSTIALTVFIWLCKGNGTTLSVHGKLEQYACSHVSWGPPTRYLSLTEVHSSYERLRDNPTKLWLSCSKHFLCSLGWHIHCRLVQICNPVALWHFASRPALQPGDNLCSMLQISQAGTWSGTFPCFLPQTTRQPKQILSENFAVSVLLERSHARLTKQDICLHHPPPTTYHQETPWVLGQRAVLKVWSVLLEHPLNCCRTHIWLYRVFFFSLVPLLKS